MKTEAKKRTDDAKKTARASRHANTGTGFPIHDASNQTANQPTDKQASKNSSADAEVAAALNQ
jgi:hypothetical protein